MEKVAWVSFDLFQLVKRTQSVSSINKFTDFNWSTDYAFFHSEKSNAEEKSYFPSRKLLAHKTRKLNCTPPAVLEFPDDMFNQKQRQHGAVVVNFLVSFYMFWAIAIVCDDYFVPCLEIICDRLGLQTDVAGATFMALGSSAPELFASVIGKNNIGQILLTKIN